MFEGVVLPRTKEIMGAQIDSLIKNRETFTIQHGTYTTRIEKRFGKMVFSNVRFRNKVFVAANMVKRDCLKSGHADKILGTQHFKKNYANAEHIDMLYQPEVYNIDIKGAYANCLFNTGLIERPTYNYLTELKKEERLPAVGMLARSHVKYIYEEGECVEVKPHREHTAELFFYLIAEIDIIMREIRFILGKYFIFYWVDGVFFRADTPAALVKEVEDFLLELNYKYSYERCTDFMYQNADGQCRILLNKSGEMKEWNFCDSNGDGKFITQMLQAKSSGKITKLPF
jgi:hypothetical protein